MPKPTIMIVPDGRPLAQEAARHLVIIAQQQATSHGLFTLALSGGSTPRALYQMLAAPPYRDQLPWQQTHIFFGDERCVGPDDDQSNYRMAREVLLDHVPLAPEQIHRMEGERDPHVAAASYEKVLRQVFKLEAIQVPTFDLVLLGIGPDGHTASLFPGTSALTELQRLVTENAVPQLDSVRITLTIPVLNQAQNVLVLVAGGDKANAVQRAIEGPDDLNSTPSQLLRNSTGNVSWLLDSAAAARLSDRLRDQERALA